MHGDTRWQVDDGFAAQIRARHGYEPIPDGSISTPAPLAILSTAASPVTPTPPQSSRPSLRSQHRHRIRFRECAHSWHLVGRRVDSSTGGALQRLFLHAFCHFDAAPDPRLRRLAGVARLALHEENGQIPEHYRLAVARPLPSGEHSSGERIGERAAAVARARSRRSARSLSSSGHKCP
jgi:hypothetical protein